MKIKILIIYAVVFLTALVLFIFLLFPGQKMAAFVTRKMQAPGSPLYQSSFQVSVKDIRPSFPFGLVSDHVSVVSDSGGAVPDFQVFVHVPLLSVYQRPLSVRVKAYPFNGLVQADWNASHLHPKYWNLKNLDVQDMDFSHAVLHAGNGELVLQGTIGGGFAQAENVPVKLQSDFWKFLSGKGQIHGKDIHVDVSRSRLALVHLPALSFTRLDGEFTMNKGQIHLKDCLFKGPVLHLQFSGNIRLADPAEESTVSLKGKVLPDSPYLAQLANHPLLRLQVPDIAQKGVVFHVTGTLGHLGTRL